MIFQTPMIMFQPLIFQGVTLLTASCGAPPFFGRLWCCTSSLPQPLGLFQNGANHGSAPQLEGSDWEVGMYIYIYIISYIYIYIYHNYLHHIYIYHNYLHHIYIYITINIYICIIYIYIYTLGTGICITYIFVYATFLEHERKPVHLYRGVTPPNYGNRFETTSRTKWDG